MNGAISYARIWTKALSDQQISEQSGKLLSEDKDGMVANWLFNNGNGNTQDPFVSLAGKSFEAEADKYCFKLENRSDIRKQVLLQNDCKKIG